jgi:polyphosphate kinase 2
MSKPPHYAKTLRRLQLALVETQAEAIKQGERVVVVFEGRDAAGKDGTIKRITEHQSVRFTRVIALPKPSDREQSEWWFQRYVHYLPSAGETVIFNRSWYNRAGVETVMGFSTPEQQAQFLRDAPMFEQMLTESGIRLVKYWLDISREEQAQRLRARRKDPLKQLKVSAMDAAAEVKWDAYSAARNQMLLATHTAIAPWTCVQADHKHRTRLEVIRHLAHRISPPAIAKTVEPADPDVVFDFDASALTDGRLAV